MVENAGRPVFYEEGHANARADPLVGLGIAFTGGPYLEHAAFTGADSPPL